MSAETLDLQALRERYALERDRRVATDEGQRRYRDVEQGFSHLLDDPYGTAPPRDAVTEEIDVFIVGGGFGGLADRRAPAGGGCSEDPHR